MAIVSREMDAYFAKLRETIPPENFFWVIYGPRLRYAWIHTAAPTQPATAVGEDGPESEDDHACGHGYPRQYRHDCPECSRCQHALKAMGKKWKALCEECGEGPCKRAAHPTPPTLHTAPASPKPASGEVEVVGHMRRTIRYTGVDGRKAGERVLSEAKVYPDDEPLVRKSDYDALAAERDRLRESLHYANGTAELAMKHRDAAEAARDAAVGALLRLSKSFPTDTDMEAAGWDGVEIEEACNAYDAARTLLTEASREG